MKDLCLLKKDSYTFFRLYKVYAHVHIFSGYDKSCSVSCYILLCVLDMVVYTCIVLRVLLQDVIYLQGSNCWL